MRILVLGASGMLGNTMTRVLAQDSNHQIFATTRSTKALQYFSPTLASNIISGIDIENTDVLIQLFNHIKPDIVINCIGLVKQRIEANDPLITIPINSLFPHRLAKICSLINARLIHISTDCVFSGLKGNYTENDIPDAQDLYGRSKLLGEVTYPNSITLRTSIIGHELQSTNGLVDWFLSQQNHCRGYIRAIFSGLPTVVLAQIIREIIIPRPDLFGLYNIAANPINKFELLKLIAQVYSKQINIIPDDRLVLDRSLDAKKFQSATGYSVPEWPELIQLMHMHK